MVRFVQISFKYHEQVACSSFELRPYIFYKTIQSMDLNILIIDQGHFQERVW